MNYKEAKKIINNKFILKTPTERKEIFTVLKVSGRHPNKLVFGTVVWNGVGTFFKDSLKDFLELTTPLIPQGTKNENKII